MATQGGWEEVGVVDRLAECNDGCPERDGGSNGRSVEVAGVQACNGTVRAPYFAEVADVLGRMSRARDYSNLSILVANFE
jgi:hypothetical protein